MNIVYLITGLGLGGAEVVTIDIANRVALAGHRVLLVYLTGENCHSSRIGPQVEVLGMGMKKTPLGFIQALFRARKTLKCFRPDIVHAQMFHATIFARLLRLVYSYPALICTEHNKNIEGRLRMKLYRWTDCLSDFNTNVSQEAVDYFIEQKAFKKANSRAIYNGIDLSKFVPNPVAREAIRKQYKISGDEFLFLNVGRLMPAKDQHNLIDAFSQLPGGKLMIAGQGELLPGLEKFAAEKGLSEQIIFAGAHKNIADFYAASDCFVLSSAWEGFGIVLAEAMACALPVITTDAGGCREVVDNPAFVVPPRNSRALAQKMNEIQSLSVGERIALGRNNRQKSSRFDIHTICMEWITIYQQMMKKNEKR